jgi:nicotinamidase-related amidase
LVVDIQEKLAPAMAEEARAPLMRAASVLVEAAATLGASVVATEQYPQGLGHTVPELGAALARASAPILEKLAFSAVEAPGFAEALAARAPRSVVVVGMETHVCVFQSVRELVARGLDVHVVADGVASRRDDHKKIGLELCREAGATLTTMETVVFDWLRRAGTDEFKKLSKLIR